MHAAANLAPRSVLLARYDELAVAGITRTDPVSLILTNLDRFKGVNMEVGHLAGDEVLDEVSALLVTGTTNDQLVARVGGDLFAVLQRCSLEIARRDAEALRQKIAATHFSSDVRLTASFGVAAVAEALSFEDLLSQSEACLYAAKANGRNCTVDAKEFATLAADSAHDQELYDNDNKIRVLTDRLGFALRLRGRKIAGRWKSEADRDGLTDLFNRRYFDRRLGRDFEGALKSSKRLSILLVDLDHFGNVNRIYGYPTGDQALRTFADALRTSIRATDWAARYGGEEFCVVLPDTSADEVYPIAERVRETLNRRSVTSRDGRDFRITVSQGIAELVPDDTCPTDLVQRASDMLRKAKNSGRDTICR